MEPQIDGTLFKVFVPMLKALKSDDGRKRLSGVASSTVRDLHGDRMTESAIADMLRAAKGDMTIFLNHQYRVPEDILGTVEKASVTHDGDVVLLSLDSIVVDDSNPRALQAAASIDNGVKLGISIGARIPEKGAKWDEKAQGYIIEHVQLLEASLVGVPANPRSWVDRAVKSLTGADPEDLDRHEYGWTYVSADGTQHGLLSVESALAPLLDSTGTPVQLPVATLGITGPEPIMQIGLSAEATESVMVLSAPIEDIPAEVIASAEPDHNHDDAADPESITAAAVEIASQDAPSTTGDEAGISAVAASALDSSRTVITRLMAERDEALRERDEAVELARGSLTETAQLLERIKATPTGRRTVITDAVSDLEGLRDVMAPEVMRILERKAAEQHKE
jgi:HK97 family phage prohead protease